MFTVSRKWIHDNTTKGGSWNAKQLRCLGIAWPPVKNWQQRIAGLELSIELKERFEKAKLTKKDLR